MPTAKLPRYQLINRTFGTHFVNNAQIWPYFDFVQFAQLEQFLTNEAGEKLPEHLLDLPGVGVGLAWPKNRSLPARNHFANRAGAYGPVKSKAHLKEWRKLVPSWYADVVDELEDKGVPFGVELLASPGINMSGTRGLFEKGARPQSLLPLGVNQRGEAEFLRSLSVVELLTDIWPHQWRYNHRPAGSPVPPGYEAGLTFGSPMWSDKLGRYVRSPIMDEPVYARYMAEGGSFSVTPES